MRTQAHATLQGNLLHEGRVFGFFENAAMNHACEDLNRDLNRWQPLKLLFIIDKIGRIA